MVNKNECIVGFASTQRDDIVYVEAMLAALAQHGKKKDLFL